MGTSAFAGYLDNGGAAIWRLMKFARRLNAAAITTAGKQAAGFQ